MKIHYIDLLVALNGKKPTATLANTLPELKRVLAPFYCDEPSVSGNLINIYLRGDPDEAIDVPRMLKTIEEELPGWTTAVCAVDVSSNFGNYEFFATESSDRKEVLAFFRGVISDTVSNLKDAVAEVDERFDPL